jgi:acetyltransferase EpsM
MNFHDYSGEYVIFGAGGLARELWGWIKNSRNNGLPKRLVAFIDDNPDAQGEYDGIPILGREKFENSNIYFILALGGATSRGVVAQSLDVQGWRPLTYIHESVLRGVNVQIGKGVLICPRVSLSSDCALEDYVLVNGGCGVAHDVIVGRHSVLLGAVSLNGNVTVGEGVTIGAGALVHPGRRIGDGAVIGMGSAVFAHVKAGVTVVGNPARPFGI